MTKVCRTCGVDKAERQMLENWMNECTFCRNLKQKYRITYWDYVEMMIKQQGKCGICDGPPGRTGLLRVDHDHGCCRNYPTCGNCVRSLLCAKCNTALGNFRDSVDLLKSAARYLLAHVR